MATTDSTSLPQGDQYSIYIFQVTSGAVKIGISNDVQRRLMQVQGGNHEAVSLAYAFACNSYEQALAIEQLLHERYKQQHLRREWYAMIPEDIIADIEFAMHFVSAVNAIEVVYKTQSSRRNSRQRDNSLKPIRIDERYFCPVCEKEMSKQGWSKHPCRTSRAAQRQVGNSQ